LVLQAEAGSWADAGASFYSCRCSRSSPCTRFFIRSLQDRGRTSAPSEDRLAMRARAIASSCLSTSASP